MKWISTLPSLAGTTGNVGQFQAFSGTGIFWHALLTVPSKYNWPFAQL
jgi:hypothetical protein